jgi:glycerol-3-phosphate acyltransferase PlsY
MLALIPGRMTSLASMVSTVAATIYICLQPEAPVIKAVQLIYCVLIIVRHRSNIDRIIHHCENKVSWIPKL